MILVSAADDRLGRKGGLYEATQRRVETIFRNNPQFGISKFLMMNWGDIAETEFYRENKPLLDNIDPAKNGLVHKPLAVSLGLNQIEEGDFLILTDIGPDMWPFEKDFKIPSFYNLNVIKKLCTKNGGILSAFVKWDTKHIPNGKLGIHTHANFTTDRCMEVMGLEEFSNSYMHASGMMVFQKSSETVSFAKEWLMYNAIDECSTLGWASDPKDYSFWDEEEHKKLGHRFDQSVSGLLINKYGYKLVETIPSEFNSYNFLNFCRECQNFKLIDPNIPSEQQFKKGDKVRNKAGIELTVFDVTGDNLVVGLHRASCFEASPSDLI